MIEYILKTKHFIPSEFHLSFFEIDFKKLYTQGYRLIITDLDNTLISYQESLPTTQIKTLFQELQEIGFDIVLLSNNHQPRLDTFCDPLNIKGFANARKPLLKGMKKAFNYIDQSKKETTVVIGDQLMTDIWGANRFGVYNILVNPLKRKTEKWYTKFNRYIEEKMLQQIKRKYPDKYQSLQLSERI